MKNFFLINTIMIVIVALFQLLKFVYLISKGALLFDILDLVVLSIPSILYVILPISTLITILHSYNSLSKTQEIAILRGAALSNLQIAKPALIFAIIISLLTYYITIALTPSFFTQLKNKTFILRNSYMIQAIEENSFNKLSSNTTIYLGKRIGKNAFQNILIFDEMGKSKIFIAKFGELQSLDKSVQLHLKNGTIQEFDDNNYLTSLNFKDFILTINLYNTQERYTKNISEYSITELLNSNKPKFIAEGHQRIIWPSYSFLLAFFSLSIFLYKPRNAFAEKVKLALYILSVIFTYFALSNLTIKAPYAIYLPYLWSIATLVFSIKKYTQN